MRSDLVESIPLLDELLASYASELGTDFVGYRNHTYRVANFCAVLSSHGQEPLERIAIAAAFHDIGIWTAGTFDYLEPSTKLASAYLARTGNHEHVAETSEMIRQHHKLRRSHSPPGWLVEPFRRADWIDVTMGVLRFGLSRRLIDDAYTIWPSAGFHKRFVQLSFRRFQKHPLSPLPMLRL